MVRLAGLRGRFRWQRERRFPLNLEKPVPLRRAVYAPLPHHVLAVVLSSGALVLSSSVEWTEAAARAAVAALAASKSGGPSVGGD